MKRKIIAMILTVCFVLASFSVGFSATEITHIDIEHQEYKEYLRYDVSTKEYTPVRIPIDKTAKSTWEAFTPAQIASMTAAVQPTLEKLLPQNSARDGGYDSDSELRLTSPSTSPYCSVVFILTYYYDIENDRHGIKRGTGFLVSDKVLVTAAHCIALPYEIEQIQVYADINGESVYGQFFTTVEIDNFIVPSEYDRSDITGENSANIPYDYCVAVLEASIYRPFYFQCVDASYMTGSYTVSVSGYPKRNPNYYYQESSSGVMEISDDGICYYTNTTIGGMSGGPIYADRCYGVHSRDGEESNRGVYFTYDIVSTIRSEIYAN